jgi:hypothetical protein
VLWVIFTFSGLLGLHRSFGVEQADRAIDGLLAAPVDREAIFLGKALANLVFVAGVQRSRSRPSRCSTTCRSGGCRSLAAPAARGGGARGGGHAVQRDGGEHAARRAAAADARAAVLRAGGDPGGAGDGALLAGRPLAEAGRG